MTSAAVDLLVAATATSSTGKSVAGVKVADVVVVVVVVEEEEVARDGDVTERREAGDGETAMTGILTGDEMINALPCGVVEKDEADVTAAVGVGVLGAGNGAVAALTRTCWRRPCSTDTLAVIRC